MGQREIHEAAHQQRRKQAAASAKASADERSKREANKRAKPKHEAQMLEYALGEASIGKYIAGAATVIGLVVPMVVGVIVVPARYLDNYIGLIPIVAVAAVSTWGLLKLSETVMATIRMRQLRHIRGLDPERYLAQLRQNRSRGIVRARMRFERPFDESTRAAIPDAVRTWWPKVASVRWDNGELVVESGECSGTEYMRGEVSGGMYVWNNREFHTAFLAIVGRVVPELDATTPVTRLDVELTGDVRPWDEVAS